VGSWGVVGEGLGGMLQVGFPGVDRGTVNLASELINSDLATAASSSICPA
jgi:hypothetical protein